MARRRFQKGSLLLRGKREKLWLGRWREDVLQPDGKIKRVCKKEVLGTLKDFPTRRLALRELDARLTTINSPSYRARPNATFKEFIARWDASVLTQHKPSTQSSIRSGIRRFIEPTFGTVQLKNVSAEMLQSFVSSLRISPKSVRNLIATLRMMWNSARAWGYVIHDPFEGIRLPARRPRQAFYFTLDEVQKIISAAPEPYKTFFWLAAETGMRAGELCGLRLEDVDVNSGIVQVRQSVWRGGVQSPKTPNAIRAFAISEELMGQLTSYLHGSWRGNSSGLLFATRNGTPWDANLVVKRKLHPILLALGIRRGGLHAFRHASATLMDQHHVPMATRQSRLGHSDPRLTMGVYTHSVSADDRRFAAEIGLKLDPNRGQVVATKNEEAGA